MMNSMMKENEHVRTAIRWRVPDDDENNAAVIEKLDDKVSIHITLSVIASVVDGISVTAIIISKKFWIPVILKFVLIQVLIFGNQRKPYTFDHVINIPDQRKLYEILVEPLVEKALEGYDCTFLASGQTGSGKTYTIGFENGASVR